MNFLISAFDALSSSPRCISVYSTTSTPSSSSELIPDQSSSSSSSSSSTATCLGFLFTGSISIGLNFASNARRKIACRSSPSDSCESEEGDADREGCSSSERDMRFRLPSVGGILRLNGESLWLSVELQFAPTWWFPGKISGCWCQDFGFPKLLQRPRPRHVFVKPRDIFATPHHTKHDTLSPLYRPARRQRQANRRRHAVHDLRLGSQNELDLRAPLRILRRSIQAT